MSERPVSTGFVPAGGGRLYYEVAGSGPPVVLVHGGMWDLRMWDPQVESFSRRHTVIRYDVRGYGRSDRPTSEPYSDRGDLRALLGHLGIRRAGLVGLSMAGGIAIDFTLEHPDMVQALVVVSSALSGYRFADQGVRAVWDDVDAAVEAGDHGRALDLELGLWAPLRTDDEGDRRIREIAADNLHLYGLTEESERPLDPPAAGRLEEIRVPTLVVVGDRDVPDILAIADLLANGIPGAGKVVIGGADHVVNLRRPDEFDRVVLGFLSEHAGG